MNEWGSNSQSILRWLSHRIWMIQQKNCDLLIRLLPDIHRPMDTGTRIFPLDLSRRYLDALTLASVAVLNREEFAF
jgi:hypothetical protein